MTKQTPLNIVFSSHTLVCVLINSNDHRVSVGQCEPGESNDHECDGGGHQDLRLHRRSADLYEASKHTMKQTHKLAT